MGMTIAEKIIAAAAGVPEVKPGDIHTVTLDRLMSNDGTVSSSTTTCRPTARKQQHPRKRCVILQERTTLTSGKEKVYAIR